MSSRRGWYPELLVDHGIAPWQMDDFTPRELRALMGVLTRRRVQEGGAGGRT